LSHFPLSPQDEADVLGDRIAIMSEGRLRCAGSSLFLKKAYGVGYVLSIDKLKEETGDVHADSEDEVEDIDDKLLEIVTFAVPEASLLSNVGSEMKFQLPMGASSQFGPMFDGLDKQINQGSIGSYGVSITTLDEVFLLVARGEATEKKAYASSRMNSEGVLVDGAEKTARSRMDLENEGLFTRHLGALLRKRAAFFRRDKKAWMCTTILPSLFVLIGFIVFKYASPGRDLDPVTLDLNDFNPKAFNPRNPIAFNSPDNPFSCQPGNCAYEFAAMTVDDTKETYFFCGYQALLDEGNKCTIAQSTSIIEMITDSGAAAQDVFVESLEEVRPFLRLLGIALCNVFLTLLSFCEDIAKSTRYLRCVCVVTVRCCLLHT
jgi:hypothetical protein